MRIIFLDIDGVLNDHKRFSNGFYGIRQENVKHLNTLLGLFPDAKIVITSSWRYMINPQSMTLDGFSNLLLCNGVDCLDKEMDVVKGNFRGELVSRVISYTHLDETIGGRNGRGKQIKHWLFIKGYDKLVDKHVVLDDMMWDFDKYPDLKLVLTNPKIGLMPKDVDKAAGFLR